MPAYALGQAVGPSVSLLGAPVQTKATTCLTGSNTQFSSERDEDNEPEVQFDKGKEEETLQAQSNSAGSGAVSSGAVHQASARSSEENTTSIHATAAQGLNGATRQLPGLDRIQDSFGHHNVSETRVQIGGAAELANKRLGASAYTSGNRIAFKQEPDLRLAAHEAAHVVQQRRGIQLKGGVSTAGDPYERQADKAAEAVVSGRSAEALLDEEPQPATDGAGVQMKCACGGSCASCTQKRERPEEPVQMDEDDGTLTSDDEPIQMQLEVTTERPLLEGLALAGGGGAEVGAAVEASLEENGDGREASAGEAEAEKAKGEAESSISDQSAALEEAPVAEADSATEMAEQQTSEERSEREAIEEGNEARKEEGRKEKGLGAEEETKEEPEEVMPQGEMPIQRKCDPSSPSPKPADFDEAKQPPPEPPPGKTEVNSKSESPSAEDQSKGCGAEQVASRLDSASPIEDAVAPAEAAVTSEPVATKAAPNGGGAGTNGAEQTGGGTAGDGDLPIADTGVEYGIAQAEAGRAEAVAAYEASNALVEKATGGVSELASFDVEFPRVEGGGEVEEKRRSAASDALRGFLSNGADRVSDALNFALNIVPERTSVAAAAAKAQIKYAAASSAAALSGRVAQARANAQTQAAALAVQINSAHDASVATIQEETNSALDTLDAEYNAAAEQIPVIESDQIMALSEVYAEGDRRYRKIGSDIGEAATKRGEFYAQHYDGCHIKRMDSFWDGYLTDRRADARMKAARDVAKSYKESLEKEANKQADEGAKGLKCDQEAVHKSAATTLETLDQQYQSAVEILLKAQERAIASAGIARDQSLASAKRALTATLAGFDDTEYSQLRTISDTAYLQVVAVEQSAHMAASSLQDNILQAADSLSDALRSVASTLTATSAPEPDVLERGLAAGRETMESGLDGLYLKIDGGLSNVEGQIADHGNQSSAAVNDTGASAIAQVDQAMAGFSQTMSTLEQSTSSSLSQLTDGHVSSLHEMTESATEGFKQQMTGLEKSYEALNANVKGRFEEAATGLETGLKDSLKGMDSGKDSIPHYADEAASKEAPAWKSVVKWILIIAIIVVVALVIGPAVIGAVGAWAGSVFWGAVIGGAIVGAATGAAIQMLNNWETNTTLYEGVGTAALMGAIGGAVGGAGGFFIEWAMGPVGKLAISAISKKAIEFSANLAFNAVQEIATQLLTTRNVDWSEFGKSMVMSLATAGAGEIPAGKKVQAKFKSKGDLIGGKIPGARAPKPEVSTGGAKPHAEAEPETTAPKAAPEPEAAAPKAGAEPETGAPKTGPEGEGPHAPPRTDAEVKAQADASVAKGDPAKAEMGKTPRLDVDLDAPIKSRTDAELAEATVLTKVGDENQAIIPRKEGDDAILSGCTVCDRLKTKLKNMINELDQIPPAKKTQALADLQAKLQKLHTKVEGADARLKANEKTKEIIKETGDIAKEFRALGEQHATVGKGLNDPKAVKAETGEGTAINPSETSAAPKQGEPDATTVKPGEEGKSAVKPGEKPLDVEKDLGVKSEPVQHLGHDDFDKVQLKPKQDALYIVRDTDGNILKVGTTNGGAVKDRFKKYKDSGDMVGIKVTLEVHPLNMKSLRGKKVKAEHFETKLREKMETDGEIMPWDNSKVYNNKGRLGFKGFGTPAERGKNPKMPRIEKDELEDLLKKHNGDTQKAADEYAKKMPNKKLHRRTILRWAQALGLDINTYKPPKGP